MGCNGTKEADAKDRAPGPDQHDHDQDASSKENSEVGTPPSARKNTGSTLSKGVSAQSDFGGEQRKSLTQADMDAEEAKIKAQKGRRKGVAAPSVDSAQVKDYRKPVYPKDQETKDRIRKTLKENEKMQVLCGHLDSAALDDVVNAFYTKDIPEGTDIIKQGDDGNCLYIIKDGTVDIFVARSSDDSGDKRGAKVATFGSGQLFGELALLYNTPRAATAAAVTPVRTWVLDALDFKMCLAQLTQAQYAKYEGWLSSVDLLKALNHYELSVLADALVTESYNAGDTIIKQGDVGQKFYILEQGTCAAFIMGDSGEKEVKQYRNQGEYFGEIALLTDEKRKATVRATSNGCSVVSLSKTQFTNLLGPISDILKKHLDRYPQYKDFLK